MESIRKEADFAVIYAGDPADRNCVVHKTHNPRPWKSYHNVATDICGALSRAKFKRLHLLEENRDLAKNLAERNIRMAWINSGGVQGYDSVSHAVGLCESLGIPYVGHRPVNAGIMDYKPYFKWFVDALGFATPRFALWDQHSLRNKAFADAEMAARFSEYQGPFVVKPASGRASNYVSIVERVSQLRDAVAEVCKHTHDRVLVEEYLPGREFCVAVTGPNLCREITNAPLSFSQLQKPLCFGQFERKLDPGHSIFTSMDQCPITGDRVSMLDQQRDAAIIAQLDKVAITLYQVMNLCALTRVDLRADSHGVLNILESNPKPDLKKSAEGVTSLIHLGLERKGIDYDAFIVAQVANIVACNLAAGNRHFHYSRDLQNKKSTRRPS